MEQVVNWYLYTIEKSPRWVTGKILFSFSIVLNKYCYDSSPRIQAALVSKKGFLTNFLSKTHDLEIVIGVAACLKSFFRFDSDMQEFMNFDIKIIKHIFAKLLHCLSIEIPRKASDQAKHLRMITNVFHILHSFYKFGYFWHGKEICQIIRVSSFKYSETLSEYLLFSEICYPESNHRFQIVG